MLATVPIIQLSAITTVLDNIKPFKANTHSTKMLSQKQEDGKNQR